MAFVYDIINITIPFLDVANLDLSEATVRRRLKQWGIHAGVAAKKEILSEGNIQARLRFANRFREIPVEFWSTPTRVY